MATGGYTGTGYTQSPGTATGAATGYPTATVAAGWDANPVPYATRNPQYSQGGDTIMSDSGAPPARGPTGAAYTSHQPGYPAGSMPATGYAASGYPATAATGAYATGTQVQPVDLSYGRGGGYQTSDPQQYTETATAGAYGGQAPGTYGGQDSSYTDKMVEDPPRRVATGQSPIPASGGTHRGEQPRERERGERERERERPRERERDRDRDRHERDDNRRKGHRDYHGGR
jgi:hypothetical protein